MSVYRKQAFSNFAWKLAEQLGSQMVSFVVSIILARLLMPEDYSVLSIITVLTSFFTVFIDSGLSSALIQKKRSDDLDFSTVLTVSLIISVVIYIALWGSSPYIADIYENELLIPIIRVYSLRLIVGAFSSVLSAYIAKNLQFKKYFLATITGTVLSGIVGVSMALSGYGAWALVAQYMTNLVVDTLVLFATSNFRPKPQFSVARLKSLWKYGSSVLGASLVDSLYNSIKPLFIGIRFSTADLAYYDRGSQYPGIINSTLGSTLAAVLFPVISKAQDDISQVKQITKKYICTASFLIFPTLLGLAAVSDNLILIMITEKWSPAVPYMQIFCINYMFILLQTGNLQALNAIGRSDLVLKLSVIKKTINCILLFILILFAPTPHWLAALGILTSLIAFLLNSFANKRILYYGLMEQVMDVLPNLLTAIVMAIGVILIGMVNLPLFTLTIIQILSGIVIYIGLSVLFRNPNLWYCLETFKSFLYKK